MTTDILNAPGITNEGGFLSPYYLYELLARQHGDELDMAGRDANRKQLPRLFRQAYNRYSDSGSTAGEVWTAWYNDLFTALGYPAGHIWRLDTPLATARYGFVPIGHGAFLSASPQPED